MSAKVAITGRPGTSILPQLATGLPRRTKENTRADNLKDRGPQDRSRINVNEDWELRYWTKELGVGEDRLRKAVEKVGVSVDAVRKELNK